MPERIVGDDGPHFAICTACGIIGKGTYGYCETHAAIHRLRTHGTVWVFVKTEGGDNEKS